MHSRAFYHSLEAAVWQPKAHFCKNFYPEKFFFYNNVLLHKVNKYNDEKEHWALME